MNNNEGSFNDEELRKRAASNEELNIRLTNNPELFMEQY